MKKVRIEGPYYGSYSLAIVNRSLAIALAKTGEFDVSISATAAENWERDHSMERYLSAQGVHYIDCSVFSNIDIVIRNAWPIEHSFLAPNALKIRWFAWEETRVPYEIIDGFNNSYNLILPKSKFVAKALVESGVALQVPVLEDASVFDRNDISYTTDKVFVHISSCFPRKAPDVLVSAFCEEFSNGEDVTLIIKTFDNLHNDVDRLVTSYVDTGCSLVSRISVIKEDFDDSQIKDLIDRCSYLILPSRGEGFGLPALEAHLRGKPVVMPRSSALAERFIDGADLEVAYVPEYAKAHVSTIGSLWFEPSKLDLRVAFRKAYQSLTGDCLDYKRRVELIKSTPLKSWGDIANDFKSIVSEFSQASYFSYHRKMGIRVVVLSSWAQKCGIADYLSDILKSVPNGTISDVLILAPKIPDSENLFSPDIHGFTVRYKRVWDYWADVSAQVGSYVENYNPDVLLIQHHTGFFSPKVLKGIVEAASAIGIPVFATLHSVLDDKFTVEHGTYNSLVSETTGCATYFVHSARELQKVNYKNVILFPHGVPAEVDWAELRPRDSSFIATSFGYIRRHKGIRELIQAWVIVVKEIPDAKLLLMTSEHPAPDSREEAEYCRSLIDRLGLNANVFLRTEYHDIEVVKAVVGYSDYCVFNYLPNDEGASGAVRVALAAQACIVVSDIELFDEFSGVVLRIPHNDANGSAQVFIEVFRSYALREEYRAKAKKFCRGANWEYLGRCFWKMVTRDYLNKP